jgi:hypothetical protein
MFTRGTRGAPLSPIPGQMRGGRASGATAASIRAHGANPTATSRTRLIPSRSGARPGPPWDAPGVLWMVDRHKGQGGQSSGRLAQPAADSRTVIRKRRPKHASVGSDTSLVRPTADDRHPNSDHPGVPPLFECDRAREPSPPIRCRHHVADVDDLCLQLDDQQCSKLGVPGEEVDDTSLAVDREGDFRPDDPAGHPVELRDHRVMHRCMRRVHEPIEVSGSPTGNDIDSNIERSTRIPQRVERERSDVPAFQPGDRRARHASCERQVRLAPAASKADGSYRRSEPDVVHRTRMAGDSLLPVAREESSAGWQAAFHEAAEATLPNE